jgi:hypothetical protein
MFQDNYYIVFPEGDVQEVPGQIPINSLVDMNGRPLALPLSTNKTIAFRVQRVRTVENKGISETFHHLELVSAVELLELVKNPRTVIDDAW